MTSHPTAAWTAQQLREAFPWDQAPQYLIHDRDHAFQAVAATAKTMGIEEVLTAPRSPWQNAYVDRFIGSVRRECLDHVVVLTEAGLRAILKSYVTYYTDSRMHLSLGKDSPQSRPFRPTFYARESYCNHTSTLSKRAGDPQLRRPTFPAPNSVSLPVPSRWKLVPQSVEMETPIDGPTIVSRSR